MLDYLKKKIKSTGYLARLLRSQGTKTFLRALAMRFLFGPYDFEPLFHARHLPFFEPDEELIRSHERDKTRQAEQLYDASEIERTYPLLFEFEGRTLRYAFIPAAGRSRGLVVMFHSWNAWLQMGPLTRWDEFDVLAPWDTFGWHRQGSWFWGEKGVNFVAGLVQALIVKHRQLGQPLFCFGGSMGGFAALWHGITLACDGIYAQCPQIDIKAKIEEKGALDRENPFGFLAGDSVDTAPDLLKLAGNAPSLPPLFLVQTQFDPINPFSKHAARLIVEYDRKRAWYGLRIHPATGHGADGTQREAAYFFSLILDKLPTNGRTA